MSNHNNLIFNAALIGALGGMQQGGAPTSGTAADYNTTVQAAKAFATQVDAGIPEDSTITSGGAGVAIASAASDNVAITKCNLMGQVSQSYWSGRKAVSATPADYAQAALACIAAYTEALAQTVIP